MDFKETDKEEDKVIREEESSMSSKNEPSQTDGDNLKSKQNKTVPKKATSGLGVIMASLGNRQHQMLEDPNPVPSPGNRKDPETNEKKDSKICNEERTDEGKAINPRENKDNTTKGTNSIEDKNGKEKNCNRKDPETNERKDSKICNEERKDEGKAINPSENKDNTTKGTNNIKDKNGKEKNLEAKKKHSLGSILAGLASRRQGFSNNTKHPEEDKSEKDVSDQHSKTDTSKDYKPENSSAEGTAAIHNNRSKVNKDFRKNYGEDADVKVKRNRSLGSGLAGLANRQHEIAGNRRQTYSSGWGNSREHYQSKKSRNEYDEGEEDYYECGQERYNEELVREEDNMIFVRGHKPKHKPTEKDIENKKKAQANNMTFEDEAELRKTHSLGAVLASLANRTFPDSPPPSNDFGRRDHSTRSSYDRDFQDFGRGSMKRTYSEEEDYEDDQRRGHHDSKNRQRQEEWEENKSKKKRKDEFDPVKAAVEMKAESNRLEKLLGMGVITVGFTENRLMAYICEICQVQLTNRMNLEAHVDGMQHLRKKNLWDKRKRIAESEPSQYKGGRSGWVKVDNDEQKSASTKSASGKSEQCSSFPTQGGDSSYGYESSDRSYSQERYDYSNQYFMQPPPIGAEGYMNMGDHMIGSYGQVTVNTSVDGGKSSNKWVASQITAPPPPPLPLKPKNAQGGANGSLLQRLDACAVKNTKDEELAFSVISALLKSLKEFNHKRGDTKFIEILTEIDIKVRCLKRSLSVNMSHENRNTAKYQTSAQLSTSTIPYSNINLSGSSASAQNSLSSNTTSPTNSSGKWYSQRRSNTFAGSQSLGVAQSYTSTSEETQENAKSSQAASSLMGSGYGSQTASKGTIPSVPSYPQQGLYTSSYSGYGTDGISSYPAQMNYYNTGYTSFGTSGSKRANSEDHSSQGKPGAKDTGYNTQGSTSAYTSYREYSSKVGNNSVMEIIQSSNEPPPPPPPEKGAANYSAQGYQTQMPPVYFQMMAPPPPYNPQN